MDLCDLIIHIHTTTRSKHNFLSVMLSIVTFVYVHLKSKGLHIERIYKNEAFWLECISKAEQFFKTCLLPEILGKYYTEPNSILTQVTDNEQSSINDTDTQKLSTSSINSETSNTGDASGSSSKSTSNTGDTSNSSSSKSTSDTNGTSSTLDQKLSAST